MLSQNLMPSEVIEEIEDIESEFIRTWMTDYESAACVVPIVRNILTTHCRYKYPYPTPFIRVPQGPSSDECRIFFPRLSRGQSVKSVDQDRYKVAIFHHKAESARIGHIFECKARINSLSDRPVICKRIPSRQEIGSRRHHQYQCIELTNEFLAYSGLLRSRYQIELNLQAIDALIVRPTLHYLSYFNSSDNHLTGTGLVIADNFVEPASIGLFLLAQSRGIPCAEIVHGSCFDARYLFTEVSTEICVPTPNYFLCLEELSPGFAGDFVRDKVRIKASGTSSRTCPRRFLSLPDCSLKSKETGTYQEEELQSTHIPVVSIALGGGFQLNSHTPTALRKELYTLQSILTLCEENRNRLELNLIPHPRIDYRKDLPKPIVEQIESSKYLQSCIVIASKAKETYNYSSHIIVTFGTSTWKDCAHRGGIKTIFLARNLVSEYISSKRKNFAIADDIQLFRRCVGL